MRVLFSCAYSVLSTCVLFEARDLLLHAVELENLELLRSMVCLELLEGALAASHIGFDESNLLEPLHFGLGGRSFVLDECDL